MITLLKSIWLIIEDSSKIDLLSLIVIFAAFSNIKMDDIPNG